jgi:hypothetical protein
VFKYRVEVRVCLLVKTPRNVHSVPWVKCTLHWFRVFLNTVRKGSVLSTRVFFPDWVPYACYESASTNHFYKQNLQNPYALQTFWTRACCVATRKTSLCLTNHFFQVFVVTWLSVFLLWTSLWLVEGPASIFRRNCLVLSWFFFTLDIVCVVERNSP